MKRIVFAICAVALLFVVSSCSKTEYDVYSTLYGTISDSGTGEPVEAATVTLSPGGRTAVSGVDGRYEFEDLDIMQYTVMAQKEGYRTNRKTVTVISGESVRADIPLIKNE